MELIIYGPLWGMDGIKLEDALLKLREAGYQGAEIALNPDNDDIHTIKECFDDLCMRMIAQHPFACGDTPEKYRKDYISKLLRIAQLRPDKINCHTGKDYFSIDDNFRIIEAAEKIAREMDTVIFHEIHRGKFSFSAALMAEYLDRFPALNLTADFSHWCVVSESLLEEQEEIVKRVIRHCGHIHARVGDSQSAQVSHPAAPENQKALDRHTEWWRLIFLHLQKNNVAEYSVTCEFGPVPYLPTLPFTNQPVASQWDMNLFMKDYLTEKFKLWNQE